MAETSDPGGPCGGAGGIAHSGPRGLHRSASTLSASRTTPGKADILETGHLNLIPLTEDPCNEVGHAYGAQLLILKCNCPNAVRDLDGCGQGGADAGGR